MLMTTFDGWETRLCGDAMALPNGQLSENELMHFRTRGSKNGVRRYQNPDGTWTPLGLKERRQREGFGESRAAKKAEKLRHRVEKREARKARAAAAKEAYIKRKASKNLKNLSDQELQNRINRIKKEIEYKELTKNPILKTGEQLVTAYLNSKEKKLDREMKRAELIVRQQEARQKLIASKAARTQARNALIDNITRGTNYKKAKANLISTKADKTIRGALRQAVGKVITKEGDRIVNEMGSQSLLMRGGRGLKKAASSSRDWTVGKITDAVNGDHKEAEKRRKEKQKKIDRKKGQELRG